MRRCFSIAALLAAVSSVHAQDNPYREDGWAKFPDGRRSGWASAIDIDKRGIRIGSVKDGKVTAFIPGLGADPRPRAWARAWSPTRAAMSGGRRRPA